VFLHSSALIALPFRNSKYCFDSSTSMFGCAHASLLQRGRED